MKQYIAFLRGINISGKNKISMPDLRLGFETLGYTNVSTYLNSGNVVFETDEDIKRARANLEGMISARFGFDIPVYIIEKENLERILGCAPAWWGTEDKGKYDNLIFILSDETADEIAAAIGDASEGMEQIQVFENVIFWTFERESYRKCNWWKKTAGAGIADKLTIRTAATVRKCTGGAK